MYSTIISFFAKMGGIKLIGGKWKEVLIAILLAIVLYQNVSDIRWVFWADTIPFLKAELATNQYELDIIEQANETLTATLADRNAEIERWSNITTQLEQSTTILQDEIAELNIKSDDKIRIIEKEVIPRECAGAMEFLYDSIPELQYNDLLQLEGDGL